MTEERTDEPTASGRRSRSRSIAARVRRVALIQLLVTSAVLAGLVAWAWSWPSPPEGEGLAFARLPAAEPAPRERFEARDGTALHYRAYEAPEADAVVIALHGSGTDSRYLASLAQEISGDGVAHVATPDLRGHGPDPVRRGDVDDPAQLERDMADLVTRLQQRWDPERIILLGHSSGGGLAARFAGGALADRVDGYLLLAPYLGHDAPSTRDESGGWAHANVGRIVVIETLQRVGVDVLSSAEVLRFRMPEAQWDGYETLSYSHRMMTALEPRDWAEDLAASPAPVRLLVGTEDEAMRPDGYVEEIAPRTGIDADLVEGRGHLDIVTDGHVADEVGSLIDAVP